VRRDRPLHRDHRGWSHGGDEDVRRLDLFIPDVARVHGGSVIVFLVLTLGTLWLMHRTGTPARVQRVGQWLVVAICVQGAIGYTQYFTGVPVLLVGIHVAGGVRLDRHRRAGGLDDDVSPGRRRGTRARRR
jgi:heme A synthase